jgi:hypothetical protein
MSVPEDLAAKILRWMEELAADTDPRSAHLRRVAVDTQALPLYADMGGCVAIRPDGELISVDWDKPKDWTRETQPRWRTIALAVGSWKYPALVDLLPARGPEDRDCVECAGTGRRVEPPVLAGLICEACLAVGWRSRA